MQWINEAYTLINIKWIWKNIRRNVINDLFCNVCRQLYMIAATWHHQLRGWIKGQYLIHDYLVSWYANNNTVK